MVRSEKLYCIYNEHKLADFLCINISGEDDDTFRKRVILLKVVYDLRNHGRHNGLAGGGSSCLDIANGFLARASKGHKASYELMHRSVI